jgi:uncharacterized protein (DUF302 family)
MKTVLTLIAGIVLGAAAIVVTMGAGAQRFMIEETKSPLAFEDTVNAISTTVTGKGWKLPKVYRLDKTMKKHGYDVAPVAVLELCHADHAYKILSKDASLKVTPFMPCRISVYQRENGEVVIARMNSGLMSKLFHRDIANVMADATGEVEGIITAAIATPPTLAAADAEPHTAAN